MFTLKTVLFTNVIKLKKSALLIITFLIEKYLIIYLQKKKKKKITYLRLKIFHKKIIEVKFAFSLGKEILFYVLPFSGYVSRCFLQRINIVSSATDMWLKQYLSDEYQNRSLFAQRSTDLILYKQISFWSHSKLNCFVFTLVCIDENA